MYVHREWMYKRLEGNDISEIYVQKIDEFLQFATHVDMWKTPGRLKCPCIKCNCVPFRPIDEVKLHLYKWGFRPNYHQWVFHGETYVEPVHGVTELNQAAYVHGADSNTDVEMVFAAFGGHAIQEENQLGNDTGPSRVSEEFFEMLGNAEKPLYAGCSLSLLSVASRLLNLKSEYNLPIRAVDGIAELVKEICPDENVMTNTLYATKKLLRGLQMPHVKIDVCPQGCMLFWKEFVGFTKCSICNAERFKLSRSGRTRVPLKVLMYLPIIPRLQRLYATKKNSHAMCWHAENQRDDGVMSHPSHSPAWKHLDSVYPSFAMEVRNVRLGLYTDGFAPFGQSGRPYSCWPVVLTPYNLPPWMCMKRPYMFLTLLIPGPSSPKGNFDVYLQPLVDELKVLWEEGCVTFDVRRNQSFTLKAAVLWTVSDFPAYAMLSGWSTSGRLACPYCMERTKSFTLKHGRKQTWFDCHRRFLPMSHIFRQNKSGFLKNKVEQEPPPPILSGMQLWDRIETTVPTTEQRLNAGSSNCCEGFHTNHNWSKQSILWQLPYWSSLLVRHNLDVMHIEKNVFDNIFYTLMDVVGKTKDNVNSRKDLKLYCCRRNLHLSQETHNSSMKVIMPKAPYSLSKAQKLVVCSWIQQLRFPDGYVSNLSRCVHRNGMTLGGFKSHDCHVFMQRLLPVTFREILPSTVWKALTETSQFFRDLCATSVRLDDMDRLHGNIAEILCKLERIFPPSFFNVMEHLPVHLPYEAKLCGPVQYRWMFSMERNLGDLKRKIANKAHVEGSVCQAYLTQEMSDFCANYFGDYIDVKSKDPPRNEGCVHETEFEMTVPEVFRRNSGRTAKSDEGHPAYLDDKDHKVAHRYILGNCGLITDYESLFEQHMLDSRRARTTDEVWTKCTDLFPGWFRNQVLSSEESNEVIRALAFGPARNVISFEQYFVNGFKFDTERRGRHKSSMNYGVTVSTGNGGKDYYGRLQDVFEIHYHAQTTTYKAVLFKCEWYDSDNGMNVHPLYHIVDVNHKKRYRRYDPFVLAYQAHQVCFTPYPSTKKDRDDWWAVFKIKARHMVDVSHDVALYQDLDNDEDSHGAASLSEPDNPEALDDEDEMNNEEGIQNCAENDEVLTETEEDVSSHSSEDEMVEEDFQYMSTDDDEEERDSDED